MKLEEARRYPRALFYLDCENEIPLTSPIGLVKCGEDALRKLSDDLGLYGPLTDATDCIFFDTLPEEGKWTKEQLTGIWVAQTYERVLGPAIRLVLSGSAADIYNEGFDPAAHFYEGGRWGANGCTPMYLAAKCGDWDGAFVRMLRCSPDINARNADGDSPLHGAASGGHAVVVQRLLELGAEINARGAWGRTPLHLAILGQNCKHAPPNDAAVLLIENNADVHARDNEGLTPLESLNVWSPQQERLKELLEARLSQGSSS